MVRNIENKFSGGLAGMRKHEFPEFGFAITLFFVFSLTLTDGLAHETGDNLLQSFVETQKKVKTCEDYDILNELRDKMEIEADKLLFLSFMSDGKKPFPATSIYIGDVIEEGILCHGPSADDTAHTTEFPNLKVCLAGEKELYVNFADGKKPEYVQFFLNVGPTHGMTEKTAKKIEMTEDHKIPLNLDRKNTEDVILFALVKDKNDLFFRKYVWVISAI